LNGKYSCPMYPPFSKDVQSTISALLSVDPRSRPSATNLLNQVSKYSSSSTTPSNISQNTSNLQSPFQSYQKATPVIYQQQVQQGTNFNAPSPITNPSNIQPSTFNGPQFSNTISNSTSNLYQANSPAQMIDRQRTSVHSSYSLICS
jgi:hypothetical protein